MKKGKMISLLVAGALLLGIAQMPGCSHDDTAIVTINLEQINSTARLNRSTNLFSKLYGLFVSNAYAYSPGPSVAWASGRDTLSIIVTGDDIGTISMSVPPTQTSFKVEVPAGMQRKITVLTANSTDANYKGINWGGHAVVDLSPGDETNITITMLPMTKINVIDKPYPATLAPNWNMVSGISVVKGYKLYRSTAAEGPYSLVATIATTTTYYYENSSLTSGVRYYYKVSVYTTNAEGELSEYNSAVTN